MIPKIIHYCWFGNSKKNKKVKKCIESWRKKLPDYEFYEWNESNFDIAKRKYTKDAYSDSKYAFVSDVARLEALEKYGGIYLDTDVVVYKNFDDILNNTCVFGLEEGNYAATSFMACESHHPFISKFLDYYSTSAYGDMKTNVAILTEMLTAIGFIQADKFQILNNDIVVYPKEYFSPYDYINCMSNKTKNTICEHLFFVSWANKKQKIKRIIKASLSIIIGKKMLIIRNIIKK